MTERGTSAKPSTAERPAAQLVAERPTPGTPRPYEFPAFERHQLANGMNLLVVPMPGRPLISASLVLRNGAADEKPAEGGATVLAARALPEGTESYNAIELVEASERLGAALHAEAGWDATTAGVEVPAERLEPALELLAELVGRPTFPTGEVDRLREERLNDLLQARADPRRRVEEAFAETIFSGGSPYHRPSGGLPETVETLTPDVLRRAYRRGINPPLMTLVVGGDLSGQDVPSIANRLFGEWLPLPGSAAPTPVEATPADSERVIRLVHRPGSVQSEIRIGHVGLPRKVPDFHAVSVMSTILGGLFNSRLNMNLREEKGYAYGAHAGFDMRRAAGPFAARAAVNTEVTVPAIHEILRELGRMRDEPVTAAELAAGREFLVGVFPLRFETPGPVVGTLSGVVIHELPDDELSRYRPAIDAVAVDDVQRVAREHIDVDRAAIVLVGDADKIGSELEGAGLGSVEIVRDANGNTRRG
ncbi:MAG: insulinase family protein [Chloroflexi bacterium]|nr:MAG: insulinase family protein [Chloroflexota bacterium]